MQKLEQESQVKELRFNVKVEESQQFMRLLYDYGYRVHFTEHDSTEFGLGRTQTYMNIYLDTGIYQIPCVIVPRNQEGEGEIFVNCVNLPIYHVSFEKLLKEVVEMFKGNMVVHDMKNQLKYRIEVGNVIEKSLETIELIKKQLEEEMDVELDKLRLYGKESKEGKLAVSRLEKIRKKWEVKVDGIVENIT